jgi:hypothetical protein
VAVKHKTATNKIAACVREKAFISKSKQKVPNQKILKNKKARTKKYDFKTVVKYSLEY